jgi:Na+-transporting methylmalonyl-CoA/oxaloacetate decarboxylase gamma subunit
MNGLTVAVTSYFIAIVISFFVAGLIQLMGVVLTHFSKNKTNVNSINAVSDVPVASSDDATIAAVIAIAKNVG